jgi:hypothetical protein
MPNGTIELRGSPASVGPPGYAGGPDQRGDDARRLDLPDGIVARIRHIHIARGVRRDPLPESYLRHAIACIADASRQTTQADKVNTDLLAFAKS